MILLEVKALIVRVQLMGADDQMGGGGRCRKEERKEALKEAAQVAKDVGTAVVPDGMQVSWSQRNTAFNTSNCPKAMYGVIEMYVLICLLVMHRCIQA